MYFSLSTGEREARYSVDALRHEVYSREESHPSGPEYHPDRHGPGPIEYNERHSSHQHLADTSARSDISADSIERNGGNVVGVAFELDNHKSKTSGKMGTNQLKFGRQSIKPNFLILTLNVIIQIL